VVNSAPRPAVSLGITDKGPRNRDFSPIPFDESAVPRGTTHIDAVHTCDVKSVT
jgi:hypothetical protein